MTYAEHGADVALAARGAEALSRTAKEIEERGVRALAVPTDVSDGAALESLVNRACDELGGIDILVNNAATGELGGSLMGVGRDEFDLIMNVNVWAPLRLCQLCRPSMQGRGGAMRPFSPPAASLDAQ